jgi:AmmeMemoRadiSam system protein A
MRPLTDEQGAHLVQIARDAIAIGLGVRGVTLDPPDPLAEAWLLQPAATFVTLHQLGQLHGCIGSIEPRRSLFEDVRHNATAAAFLDPRALPLRARDLAELEVEVSLLGPLEPISFTSEADALSQLEPHVDGVVLAYGDRRATFLPQVWESLPDPAEFLAHLKAKAGLPPDFWDSGIKLSRYRLQKWSDDDLARLQRSARAAVWS